MTRSCSLIFYALLGTGLAACGNGASTSSKNPLDLVPVNDTVSGWTVDETIIEDSG